MLITEKIEGNVQNEALLCRHKLDQAILLLIAVSTIVYTRIESKIYDQVLVNDPRFWIGLLFLFSLILSYLDTRIKKLVLGSINKIPFIIIPTMLANLYIRNIDIVYTIYFLGTYISLLFLLHTQKSVLSYILIFTLGIAVVLLIVDASLYNELILLIGFAFFSALVWIVNSEFLWNSQRLSTELNRSLQLDYLHSHKLRAPIARIIGLNQLIDMGDKSAYKLLKNEIKNIDLELHNIQSIINKPVEKSSTLNISLPKLSPFELSIVLAEIILLFNVYIF